MTTYYDTLVTPIGLIGIVVEEDCLIKVEVIEEYWNEYLTNSKHIFHDSEKCSFVTQQIEEYFNGLRKDFDVKYELRGTPFQLSVWNYLKTIPYGITNSYKDVALGINNPLSVRAVGGANRRNPLPIIIPCHRVIGADGSLVGYAKDHTSIKKILLELEEKYK